MSFGFGVGDCITLSQSAWRLYKTLRDSSNDFNELTADLESMHAALSQVEKLASHCTLDEESKARLAKLQARCLANLESIGSQLREFQSLGTKKKRTRDRLRWGMETVSQQRQQLILNTNALSLFISSLTVLSQAETFPLRDQGSRLTSPAVNQSPCIKPAQVGIVLACMRCKLLKIQCTDRFPCASCNRQLTSLTQIPCRRGPLKALAGDMIPLFFLPSQNRHDWNPSVKQKALHVAGGHPINICWGLLGLSIPLGSQLVDIDAALTSAVPQAMLDFQRTFPDANRFRVKVIDLALSHADMSPGKYSAITTANKVLMLSLMIAHYPGVRNFKDPHLLVSQAEENMIHEFLADEVRYIMSVLLENSLKKTLTELQVLIARGERKDWAEICFTLCLIFFAAESMQVDIYQRARQPASACESMEKKSILLLAELFKASTQGFNPLDLDWDEETNMTLIGNDVQSIESIQNLQTLSQEYWGFMSDRRVIEYEESDTDCLTGKLVSTILLDGPGSQPR